MHSDTSDPIKYKVKVQVFKNKKGFGPGIAKIMDLVEETGRLSDAYKAMYLAPSKGWKIIKRAEEEFGFPLIISEVGGSGGGKSYLSQEGEDLLKRYKLFVSELDVEAERIFNKHFKCDKEV
jgi:molybdate transport system regulatory protein